MLCSFAVAATLRSSISGTCSFLSVYTFVAALIRQTSQLVLVTPSNSLRASYSVWTLSHSFDQYVLDTHFCHFCRP